MINRRLYSSDSSLSNDGIKVLYLNASGSNKYSFTGETAREFLAQYKELHPSHAVEEVNLWDSTLLHFDLSHVESKMRISGGVSLPDDDSKFLAVQEMTQHLLSANKLMISCPMWNFSVPYVLKQYIDCVVHSGLTFQETEHGNVEGLVVGRPLLMITASSEDFSKEPYKKMDFQVPFLKTVFGFIGFRDFRHIYIANTKYHKRTTLMEYARKRVDEEVIRF